MGYCDHNILRYYWTYASNFVLFDNFFASVASYTLPAHLYLISAQSGGYVKGKAPMIFGFRTIMEELHEAGISWKYYVGTNLPGHVSHEAMNQPNDLTDPLEGRQMGVNGDVSLLAGCEIPAYGYMNPLPRMEGIRSNPDLLCRDVPGYEFYDDVQSGNLPQVAWIMPAFLVGEHPWAGPDQGQKYVVTLVNTIMNSQHWEDTAIFITWDEWGGFCDHVPPLRLDKYGLGFRVPAFLISPYAKENYVSHRLYEFSSFLTIENQFGLSRLTNRDSGANSFSDEFDFTRPPRPPLVLDPWAILLDGTVEQQRRLKPQALQPRS